MSYMVSNTHDYLQKDDFSNVDHCINGTCSNCGSCCTNFIPVTDAEISRIKKFIRKHDIRPCSHGFEAPLRDPAIDMICPFRDDEKKTCRIYEVRPAICEGYQCNRSPAECAQVMRRNRPGFRPEQVHYINVRLTFFGADEVNTLAGQLQVSRMMAFKQKMAFGANTDEWL